MFEGLLERILLSYFGKFIEGVDKRHIKLGVLSGNLIIENVSLKREAIDALDLPIKLRYSSISKLQLLVPWSKLSTSRVEILVENVYVLVSAKSQQEWNLKDVNSFIKKFENIQNYIKEYLKNKQQAKQNPMIADDNSGQNEKQGGYLEKLIAKIIDNIYIQITNVHFRYEHDISRHSFSWGITIQKIEQETVDGNWDRRLFYDRYELVQQESSINKRISLEKFSIYWNSEDNQLICNQVPQMIQMKMQLEMMFEPDTLFNSKNNNEFGFDMSQLSKDFLMSKYIISIVSKAYLTQTINHMYQVPEYQVRVDFPAMIFTIKHNQVQEILWLIEFFNEYQYALKIERDLYKIRINRPDKSRLLKNKDSQDQEEIEKEKFQYYQQYWNYSINEMIKDNMRKKYIEYTLKSLYKHTSIRKVLSYQEYQYFKWAVIRNSVKDLQDWTIMAYEIKDRTKNVKDLQSEKWKFWRKHQAVDEETRLKQIIEREVQRQRAAGAPEDYVWLELNIGIKRASVKLSRRGKGIEEGFQINCDALKFRMLKRNNNFEVDLTITDMETQMFSIEPKNNVSIPIIKKISNYEYTERPLLLIHFEKHPISKPQFFSSIQLEFESIQITLYLAAMRRILAFFRVAQSEEKREAMNQQIDNLQNQSKASFEAMLLHSQKHELKIQIYSPLFVIPSLQINDPESDCWVFKLGDFSLTTVDKSQHQYISNSALQQGHSSRKSSIHNYDRFTWSNVNSGHPTLIRPINMANSHDVSDNSVPHHRSSLASPNSQQINRNSMPQRQRFTYSPNSQPQHHHQRIKLEKIDKFYDNFVLKLESLQLQYYSSLNFFYSHLKFSKSTHSERILNHKLRSNSTKIDVIEKLSIRVYIYVVKQAAKVLGERPNTKIRFVLQTLNVLLTPLIPTSVKALSRTLSASKQDSTLSTILQAEKEQILRFSTQRGYLKRRGSYFRSWTEYYAVLSGWYIYCYLSEKDLEFDHYIGIKEATVQDCNFELGVPNTFKIKTERELMFLQGKSLADMKRWVKCIQQKVYDISQRLLPMNFGSNSHNQRRNEEQKQEPDERDNSLKAKFLIEKIDIQFKDTQVGEGWAEIAINQVYLKYLSHRQETYARFTIKNVLIREGDFDILSSLIQVVSPIASDLTPQKPPKLALEKYISHKYDVMLKRIHRKRVKIRHAFKVSMILQDAKSANLSQVLIVLSELNVNYRKSTVERLMKFFSNQRPQATEVTEDNLNTILMKQQSIKRVGGKQNVEFQEIPSHGVSQVDLSKLSSHAKRSPIPKDDSMNSSTETEENFINIYLITKDIRVYVNNRNAKHLFHLHIDRMFGVLSVGDDFITLSGDLMRVELIDEITLAHYHAILGCTKEQHQHQKVTNNIFSSVKETLIQESPMVQFTWNHFSPSYTKVIDHIYDTLQLSISYSYIDYLHASYYKMVEYLDDEYAELQIPKRQSDIFELEKDFETLATNILNPRMFKVIVVWHQPHILLKPLSQSEQSIVFETRRVTLELSCSLEKNRFTQQSSGKSRRMSQILESVWCSNLLLSVQGMSINMKQSDNRQVAVSNRFNMLFRLQTPLFVNEYESLFPNMGFNKHREVRFKVSTMDLKLFRQDFLFFVEVLNTNLKPPAPSAPQRLTMKSKTQDLALESNESARAVVVPKNDLVMYFTVQRIRAKLMDFVEPMQRVLPLVEFEISSIVASHKSTVVDETFLFSIDTIQSFQYEYTSQSIERRGIINRLEIEPFDAVRMMQEIQFIDVEGLPSNDIASQLKAEFYEQTVPEMGKGQLCVKGYVASNSDSKLKVQFLMSKFLFNVSYLTIINNFFAVEAKASRTVQQQHQQARRKFSIKLRRSLILLHGPNEKHSITIQGEIHFRIEDLKDSAIKRNVRANLQNLQVFSAVTEEIYRVQLQEPESLKNLKKRQILSETQISYNDNISESMEEGILNTLHDEEITLQRIRIHISYQDFLNIYETYQFQEACLEAAKTAFINDIGAQEMDEDEPQKPQGTLRFSFSMQQMNSSLNLRQRNRLTLLGQLENTLHEHQLFSSPASPAKAQSHFEDIMVVESIGEQFEDEGSNQASCIMRQKVFKTKGLEVVVINDLSKSYVPLMLFKASFEDWFLENNDQSELMSVQVTSQLSFFNPIAGKMEPVIEKHPLKVSVIRNYHHQPNIYVTVVCKVELNVNISLDMMAILTKVVTLWRKKFQAHNRRDADSLQVPVRDSSLPIHLVASVYNTFRRPLQQSGSTDKVTLFTVQNHSGYELRIIREDTIDGEEMVLPLSKMNNYNVESHEDEYAKTFENSQIFTIVFKVLEETHRISNVQVNEVSTKKYNYGNSYLICSIQMHDINKTVLISSPYVIQNNTNGGIQVLITHRETKLEFLLSKGVNRALPAHIVDDSTTMQICFLDRISQLNSNYSNPISVYAILKLKSLTQVVHIVHGKFITVARNESKPELHGVSFISLHPMAYLVNCLPMPLEIQLFNDANLNFQTEILQSLQPKPQLSSTKRKISSYAQFEAENSVQTIEIRTLQSLILIQPQGEFQIHNMSHADSLQCMVKVRGFDLSEKVSLFVPGTLVQNYKQFMLMGDSVRVHIKREIGLSHMWFYFYVECCIINTTLFDLQYYTLEDGKCVPLRPERMRSRQSSGTSLQCAETDYFDKITVTNDQKNLMLGLQDGTEKSNEVKLSVLGSMQLQLKHRAQNYELYEFGLYITMMNSVPKYGIFTKVIEVNPKYVIINKSDRGIALRQSDNPGLEFTLKANERQMLVWPNCRCEKALQIRNLEGNYTWSGDLFLGDLRTAHFYSQPIETQLYESPSFLKRSQIMSKVSLDQFTPTLQPIPSIASNLQIVNSVGSGQRLQSEESQRTEMKYLANNTIFPQEAVLYNTEIIKEGSTFYVLIESANEETYAYKLQNDCTLVKVHYSQYSVYENQNREWRLPNRALQPFAWEHPSHAYKLKVRFVVSHVTYFQQQFEVFDLMRHTRSDDVTIRRQDGQIIYVQLEKTFRGKTQILRFSDSLRRTSKRTQLDDQVTKVVQLAFDSLGVSLMVRHRQRIVEANYLYLKLIEFGVIETQAHRTAQLRIKFFSMDNNTSYDTITPVSVTPQKYKALHNNPSAYFFDLSFQRNHLAEAITMLDFVRLSVCPITVRLDEEYIGVIAEAIQQFRLQFENENEEPTSTLQPLRNLVFTSPSKRDNALRLMSNEPNGYRIWNCIEIRKSHDLIYAREILLPPIDIIFSFHKKFVRQTETFYLFNLFSTAVGTAIQNINEAPIYLLGLRLENVYDTNEILGQTIMEHYRQEFVKSIFAIIGSIELIGNPVRLFQRISAGVVDFVEKPIQGLRHGPLDFGIGLLQGTGSLVKNTLSGAFYSINKLTGSISTGVSLLSMDDEFLERRRVFMLRPPKHIIDGLEQGCRSVCSGIADGITGVVMQPIRGTERGGFVGFLKGTALGLAGLIVKPITGILDASAKTAESISNTASHFDDRAYNDRIRVPRAFYERSRYYMKYNPFDAELMHYLQSFQRGVYKDIDYLCAFMCADNVSKVFILSYQYLLIIDRKENQRILELKTQLIHDCVMQHSKFIVSLPNRIETIEFHPVNQEEIQLLAKINYIHEQVVNVYSE